MCLWIQIQKNKYVLTKEVKTRYPLLAFDFNFLQRICFDPPSNYWLRCFWTVCLITMISMDYPPSFWTSLPQLGFRRTDKQIPVCVWYTVAERCTECTTLPHVVHQLVWINILHVSSLKDYPRAIFYTNLRNNHTYTCCKHVPVMIYVGMSAII